jgi:hypothetical protein
MRIPIIMCAKILLHEKEMPPRVMPLTTEHPEGRYIQKLGLRGHAKIVAVMRACVGMQRSWP